MIAFDADVLIYAAAQDHPLGVRVAALFADAAGAPAEPPPIGIGSLLLLPEVLSNPMRTKADSEVDALISLLSRLDLRPVDQATAELAVELSATHALKAADAVHLATAVIAGADYFLTNNSRDLADELDVIKIVHPGDLPTTEDPAGQA